jgi:5-methyltetrahydropteroyltriglutamate--homocysteine methyltransferase
MATKTIYRADVVGSMLRPPELIEARAGFREGALPEEVLRAAEDAAVDDALRIQEDAGVDVVTDGEMRRDVFFDFFVSGADGLEPAEGWVVRFRGEDEEPAMEVHIPFVARQRLRQRTSPGLAEFRYARERTDLPVKVALPSPGLVSVFWTKEGSGDVYPDVLDLVADATAIVKAWVVELADAGCPYIQIDAPELNQLYADARVRAEYAERGIDVDRFLTETTEHVGEIAGLDLPASTTLSLHVCKGNGTQAHIASGGYEDLTREVVARAPGFDAFHLEFDDARSGGFEPLRHLPDDKIAALGLVSTKWTALEDVDLLKARLEEAAAFHPLEHLAIGTQCGFASGAETAEQRAVTTQSQADKLALVARTARAVWG